MPPKKKIKYIEKPKEQNQHHSSVSQKNKASYIPKKIEQRTTIKQQKSRSYQTNLNSSNKQKQQVTFDQPQKQVQFKLKQFIYLWIGKQISNQKLQNLQVKMDHKKGVYHIKGSESLLFEYNKIWQNYIQYNGWLQKKNGIEKQSIKKIQRQGIQYKIYMQQQLVQCLAQIQSLYRSNQYKQFRQIRNLIEENQNFILMSYEKSEQSQIKRIISDQQSSEYSKSDEEDMPVLQNNSSSLSQSNAINFYNYYNDSRDNASNQDSGISRDENKEKKLQKKGSLVSLLTSQSSKKRQIYSKQISSQIFNQDDFREWVTKNQKIDMENVDIKQEPTKKIIRIALYSNKRTEDGQNKERISLFKYFDHKKLCLIDDKKKNNVLQTIQTKYCKDCPKGIKCQIIQGTSYQLNQNKILDHYIRQRQKNMNRYNRNMKSYTAVLISGIKNIVQQTYDNVKDYIQNADEDSLRERLHIQVDDAVRDYLDEDQVQSIIKAEINQKIEQQFPQYHIHKITIAFCQITVQIDIQPGDMKIYEQKNKQKICSELIKDIHQDIEIDKLLYENLSKNFLIRSNKQSNKYMLITKSSETIKKITKLHKQLEQLKKSIQQIIQIQTKYFPLVRSYLQTIKNQPVAKQYLDQINISFNQKKQEIRLVGWKIYVREIYSALTVQVDKVKGIINQTTIIVSQKQAKLFQQLYQEGKIDCIKKYNMEIKIDKRIKFGMVISLSNQKYLNEYSPLMMYMESHYSLDKIVSGYSFIFDSEKQISKFNNPSLKNLLHEINNTKSQIRQITKKHKNGQFIFRPNYRQNLDELINTIIQNSPQKRIIIGFVMPETKKIEFINSLIKILHNHLQYKQFRLYVLQNPQNNIQNQIKLAPIKKGHKLIKSNYLFYVQQGGKKFYYAKSGNQKIVQARQNKQEKVFLNHQDVNMNIITHIYDRKAQQIVHIKSGKIYPVKVYPDKMTSKFDNKQIFEFPDSQFQLINARNKDKVQITLGFYEINFNRMEQINRFSGFKRRLQFQTHSQVEFEYQYHLNIKYDYEISKINIFYQSTESQYINMITKSIKQIIEQNKCHQIYKLDQKQIINDTILNHLKSIGAQFSVQINYDEDQKQIDFKAFDKSSNGYLFQMLGFMLKQSELKQVNSIQYPKYWQKQENDIETFIVSKNTQQFKQVQKAFKYSIAQLIRIQNKLVYKKYYEEKLFLRDYINSGKQIRQLNLFHGTRNTNPQLIYKDKQESFNINYTSDHNTMGKGTYFAQQSAYSINYSFKQSHSLFGLGRQLRSLFYCSVLVGNSQQITTRQSDRKDTDYKDQKNKLRYESTTAFLGGSQIYVVYKNRRAYPLYLIKFKCN